MRLLKEEDPEGVNQRTKRRLKRRVYRNKVCDMCAILLTVQVMSDLLLFARGQTTFGTSMGMTN